MTDLKDIAETHNAWPFQEARELRDKRLKGTLPEKGYVLFQTGYGPSGLPHIGTFGEVVRTTMVRRALELLTGMPTKLFAFSDDMDGLRKVPDNVPEREMLEGYLDQPLTKVPDPFGTHDSFGAHNNARLREFLDAFGFEYEFKSSTECYASGMFDETLLDVLACYDKIMGVMLPTLGEERRQTYSPFLPLSPKTGKVLQVPILERNESAGTVVFEDEDGTKTEVPVTGGHCKLQWKPDWGMRWRALDVDYEMSGKDLIDSVKASGAICRILGGTPPSGFNYELFLDENGEKISKSKGNGLSVEEWLTYAPDESLALFMYQQPRRAKRLYFDVIPKSVDDYLAHVDAFPGQEAKDQLNNPAWHIHGGDVPAGGSILSFSMLLNLASVVNAEEADVLWGFISNYAPDATPESEPMLARLVAYAIRYYQDFVKPEKSYRAPDATEKAALEDLVAVLKGMPADADAEALQNQVYEVGKRHDFENLRDWFRALYETLLGQSQGPRFGSFIALYGAANTIELIETVLAGKDPAAA